MPLSLKTEALAEIGGKTKTARLNFFSKAFFAWVQRTFHKKSGFPKPDTALLQLMYSSQIILEKELPEKGAVILDAEAGASPFYKVMRNSGRQTMRQHTAWILVPIGSVEEVGYQDTFGDRSKFDDEMFDGITMLNRFHKLTGMKDTKFIVDCERLLKPGGIAIISPFLTWKYYTEKHPKEIKIKIPGFTRRYDMENIKDRIFQFAPDCSFEFMSFESGRTQRHLTLVIRKDQ